MRKENGNSALPGLLWRSSYQRSLLHLALKWHYNISKPDQWIRGMTAPLFMGVDGGGTRCSARLRDADGRLLGEGAAGPANARLGEPAIVEVLKACRAALASAGLDEEVFAHTHAGYGLAGTQQEEHRQWVLAQPHPFASLA